MTSIPAAHPAAASGASATTHQPYVPASQAPAELTLRAIVLGVLLGLIFGASNVYLALKIGLTVSASIPIAVLSITIFRWLGRSTILENNIVQTTGSAADSVSAGVVFTIPAILLMGYDLDISRVTILAIAGGLMGVLMMIPLRRALIVKEHGNLPYPEGTACAEVLIAGERGGIHARTVFQAFGIAFLYKFLMTALKLWQELPGKVLRGYQNAEVRVEVSPELLGVGYIIGPRIAGYLFAGGCLAYVVLMPAIKLFGSAMTEPISGMTIAALIAISFIFLLLGWNQIDDRVRAISIACVIAVAVANGGNTSQDLKTGFLVGATPRRQQIAILIGAIGSALAVGWTLTFLNNAYRYEVPERRPGFVAPASGKSADGNVVVHSETMTHFGVGGTDSIDNNTYQVIRVYVQTQGVPPGKYLVDPAAHDIRYVVDPGIGGRIHEYAGHDLKRLDSPKATLMALITDGILTHKLPWALVLIGVCLTIAIELMGVGSLPVAGGA